MRGLIDALPDEQRRVIELAYFGGFTHEQIARMLDAPLGTVKGRMRSGAREDARQNRPGGGAAMSDGLEHREYD